MDTAKAKLNGNKFVSEPHLFIPGEGCFFRSLDIAKAHGCSPNGVGLWIATVDWESETYYQAGNRNVWD